MPAKKNRGFTLLELMITVVVVAILASIAVPSYMRHIQTSRREMAKAALLDGAQKMETFYSLNFTYIGAASGATPRIFSDKVPKDGAERYYTLTISGASRTNYQIIATPNGAQSSDSCGNLSINRTGTKAATGSASGCW